MQNNPIEFSSLLWQSIILQKLREREGHICISDLPKWFCDFYEKLVVKERKFSSHPKFLFFISIRLLQLPLIFQKYKYIKLKNYVYKQKTMFAFVFQLNFVPHFTSYGSAFEAF